MIAWFNGELLPYEGITIKANDRGYLLGDGCFETLCTFKGNVLFYEDHYNRFKDTVQKLKLTVSFTKEEILKAIEDILFASRLHTQKAAIRLTVSRGSAPRGLAIPENSHCNFMISCAPAPDIYPAFSLFTSAIRRNEFSPSSQLKTICYIDNILAMEEAKENGFDDALMLNTHDQIAETTTSNIFFIKGRSFYTPALESGCLAGIMRKNIIRIAPDLGFKVHEDRFSKDFIQTCEGAFSTNSISAARPIKKIDDKIFSIHPICSAINTHLHPKH